MTTGSGLCAQWGAGEEATFGTAVTVSKFYAVNSGGLLELEKKTKVSEGLRSCLLVPTADRRVVVSRSVSGDVELDAVSKGMGLLFKHMLGSSPAATQIGTGPLYRQIHTPGALTGKGLTVQGGAPESYTGNVKPFTYRGCKITDWELACKASDLLTVKLSLDGVDVDTTAPLAAASYPTPIEVFHFADLQVKIGGTATTAAGLTTVADGVDVKGCRGVTLKGKHSQATDRYLAGAAGRKGEQIENGFREYNGELDTEFADQAQIFDLFNTDGPTPIELIWTGQVDLDGNGTFPRLSVLYPSVKLDKGTPSLGGPDILDGGGEFSCYSDPAGVNPLMQLLYDTTDTTV